MKSVFKKNEIKNQKCKVLHIVPGFLFGGVESLIVNWYTNIDRNDIQFDIVKVTPPDRSYLVRKIEEMGGNVFSIPPLGFKTFKEHIIKMKEIIDHGGYSVIHSHSLDYSLFPLIYAKKKKIPIRILHSHTTEFNSSIKTYWIKYIFGKRSLQYGTHFFSCSKNTGNWAFRKKNFIWIKNGINTEEYKYNPNIRGKIRNSLGLNNKFVLGNISRITEVKNHSFLVDVFYEIYKRNSKTALVIVGDGPLKSKIQKKVNDLGLSKAVIFTGLRSDISNLLQAMDLFILPSLCEGFPLTIVEAQASGLKCLVSDIVTKDIKITNLVEYFSLKQPPITWAEKVLKHSFDYNRTDTSSLILSKGFDIRLISRQLQSFYLSAFTH